MKLKTLPFLGVMIASAAILALALAFLPSWLSAPHRFTANTQAPLTTDLPADLTTDPPVIITPTDPTPNWTFAAGAIEELPDTPNVALSDTITIRLHLASLSSILPEKKVTDPEEAIELIALLKQQRFIDQQKATHFMPQGDSWLEIRIPHHGETTVLFIDAAGSLSVNNLVYTAYSADLAKKLFDFHSKLETPAYYSTLLEPDDPAAAFGLGSRCWQNGGMAGEAFTEADLDRYWTDFLETHSRSAVRACSVEEVNLLFTSSYRLVCSGLKRLYLPSPTIAYRYNNPLLPMFEAVVLNTADTEYRNAHAMTVFRYRLAAFSTRKAFYTTTEPPYPNQSRHFPLENNVWYLPQVTDGFDYTVLDRFASGTLQEGEGHFPCFFLSDSGIYYYASLAENAPTRLIPLF
ncbi:MAG: hypothetical protein E7618_06450 [Ruminococcaceae bacterium]|nr:hypothetical protein [Oscillospiraceae bacterium]